MEWGRGFLVLLITASAAAQAPPSPQEVVFPSGSLQLHGFLWRPAGQGPFAAILWNHGSEKRPARSRNSQRPFCFPSNRPRPFAWTVYSGPGRAGALIRTRTSHDRVAGRGSGGRCGVAPLSEVAKLRGWDASGYLGMLVRRNSGFAGWRARFGGQGAGAVRAWGNGVGSERRGWRSFECGGDAGESAVFLLQAKNDYSLGRAMF